LSLSYACGAHMYRLALHDALPISSQGPAQGRGVGDIASLVALHRAFLSRLCRAARSRGPASVKPLARVGVLVRRAVVGRRGRAEDRKSTRLNSSHVKISYAVFCLK